MKPTVFQILPKSVLSIDHGRGLVMGEKAYKSISHYAGSSVLCRLNKVQYENITKMSELKMQLVSLFHDCYRQFIWSKIKQAIDIQVETDSFREWLLQTGDKPIYYITFNRDLEFGVSLVRSKVQGRNLIGRYLQDLRRSQLEKRGPVGPSKKLMDDITFLHFTHGLLTEYVQETGNKVNPQNFQDAFLYSLKKRFTGRLTAEDKLYLQSHSDYESAAYLLQKSIKELSEGRYADEYKQNVYELYVNNQLTEEEMLGIGKDTFPPEYYDMINQRVLDRPQEEPSEDLEAEKEIVLNVYLKDFYQRNNVSKEEQDKFKKTASLSELRDLADRVWDLFQRKLVHPDVYTAAQNIFHSKEFSLFQSPPKSPTRKKAKTPSKPQNPLDILEKISPKKKQVPKSKFDGIVIRENADPMKSDPKSLNAYSPSVVMNNLAYPSWMIWVYSQAAQYLVPEPDKDNSAIRKSFLLHPASDKDPNPTNFLSIGVIANVAWGRAQATMNELLLKYIREGLVERMHRDAEFRQDLLLTGNDTLQYWNPMNLYLGVNLVGQGENRVGKFLETIRSELVRDQPAKPIETFPIEYVFSEGGIRYLVQDKVSGFVHRLYVFEQYLQEPRAGYVPRAGGVTSDDIAYLQAQLGSGCGGALPKTSDIPQGFSGVVSDVLGEFPTFQTPSNLPGLLWQGVEPFLYMVWKYLFTSKVANEAVKQNETAKAVRLDILNEMSEWAAYAYPRTRTSVEMALNRAKDILLEYVPNVTDKEHVIVNRYAPLLLIGKEAALFYLEHPYPDDLAGALVEFCNKHTDRWLWIHSFNGFYTN